MWKNRIFGGLDGYKQAINEDVDMVVIATPPGFKPQQFEYAINQGKKVFMETSCKDVTARTESLPQPKSQRKGSCGWYRTSAST